MKTKITTDWHVSANRVGGTTPASQFALRKAIRDSLTRQLDENDHIVAGDLFNDFTVDTGELMATYHIFAEWLIAFNRNLVLLRGNHDFHESAAKVSSFDLLGTILKSQFPDQVTIADKVTEWKQFVLIPHLPNNDTFNLEISKLKDVRDKVIVLHANVDNFFAKDSMHSLSISMEQVEDLVGRGNLIVCGHEHQYRTLVNDRCLILGNTFPSSIADCLGSPFKYAAMIDGTGYELVKTWDHLHSYIEVDWRDLSNLDGYDFIRVTGEAKAEEAAEVIKAISKLRQNSSAHVVGNSVRVDDQNAISDMSVGSADQIRGFDVLAAILDNLDDDEKTIVKGLLT